eukprot:CAMPEP_0180119786 /NCGR_PEP_ID=MMETSP0986-20121125/2172_1 /TAXON_ID=697907 /ORGANISM="non described non described, Strain CCMP2293" /LENGTH=146 /DNA_ID=CAMNT_0022058819 /DNA_START=227 /DNA_END=667 /DNA_ORIENTATION=-
MSPPSPCPCASAISSVPSCENGASGVKRGASGVKGGASGVKCGASGVKSGASGVESGAPDVKSGASAVAIRYRRPRELPMSDIRGPVHLARTLARNHALPAAPERGASNVKQDFSCATFLNEDVDSVKRNVSLRRSVVVWPRIDTS